MTQLPDIRDAHVQGRTILLRADLNIPFRDGHVAGRKPIARLAATVSALADRGARVVVMGHLGRPNGEPNPLLSLAPIAAALAAALEREVVFVPDCVGGPAEHTTRSLPERGVAMLENLRFHPGEQANDRSFALLLSVHGDIYVNDAFVPDYGAPASLGAILEIMPAYAGPSLSGEAATSPLHGIVASPIKNIVTEDI